MSKKIYRASYVVPINDQNEIIEDGAIVVDGGSIIEVGKFDEVVKLSENFEVEHFDGKVIIPGLINTHSHSGMLRGTAEGLPVWEWLARYIDPMHRVLKEEDAKLSSYLCYSESLLSGTTTVVDMWRYMDGSAEAAEQLGIRAILVPYVAEHHIHNYFETLDSNEQLIIDWHKKANGRINVWVGLEHIFYANKQAIERIKLMCEKYGVGFHTHSNESRFDVEETQKRYGVRPIKFLEKEGILDIGRVLLAHCVWLDDEEIATLKKYAIGVAHNPISNMKLASGIAPIEKMLAEGIDIGLGTDGEKENNNLDMFEEMKTASLLAKCASLNAASLDSWDVLKMATIGGAKALGMGDEIGSLEPGKKADFIAVDIETPRMTPLVARGELMNIHHNIVHAVRGGDVVACVVDGIKIVENGQLLTGDIKKYMKEVNVLSKDLFLRRDNWLRDNEYINLLDV